MTHALLIASVATLGAGPLIARFARQRPGVLALIDGFVLITIGGLVLLDIVPHVVEHRDWIAGFCMLAGFGLPTLAERLFRFGVRQTHAVVLLLALFGVAIHSALDGSALARSSGDPGNLLGVGVILHQLPVSLMVWWVLSDRPRLTTWLVLGLMVVTTVSGYYAEPTLFAQLPASAGVWFEALVGGSLLHVIGHPAHAHAHDSTSDQHVHSHSHGHPRGHRHAEGHDHAHDDGHARPDNTPTGRRFSSIGAAIGAGVLAVLALSRQDSEGTTAVVQVWHTFAALAFESAPAVLLAYLMAGLVHAFIPPSSLTWLSRGSRPTQGMKGLLVGLPLPICSCGVVPLYQSLVKQGASTTAALAFLVATPEIGLDAILLSVPLLGTPFTIVRVIAAAVAALSVALMLGHLQSARVAGRALPQAAPLTVPSLEARLRMAFRTGFGEMVDHTAPWILFGLVMAAVAAPVMQGSWLTRLPQGVDVLVFALIGLPLYVCASASTPLVAVLVAAGVSPGAGLALLLTGPATNVATIGVLTRMHGRPFALAFAAVMAMSAIVLGVAVNLLLPSIAFPVTSAIAESAPTVWQFGTATVVVILYGASLIRRGPRDFLRELRLSQA